MQNVNPKTNNNILGEDQRTSRMQFNLFQHFRGDFSIFSKRKLKVKQLIIISFNHLSSCVIELLDLISKLKGKYFFLAENKKISLPREILG